MANHTLSLKTYTFIANRLICKHKEMFGKGRPPIIYYDDTLIGSVVNALATADSKYDPAASTLTKHQYRRMYGIYAIRKFFKKKKVIYKTNSDKVFDDHTVNNMYRSNLIHSTTMDELIGEENLELKKKILPYLIENSKLSPKQLICIRGYLSGRTAEDMSREVGCKLKSVYYYINSAIKLMTKQAKLADLKGKIS